MKLYACINYNFVIAGGVGVITTIIAGIVGALLAFFTARRRAKIGEKSNTYSFQVHVMFRFVQYGRQYIYVYELDTINTHPSIAWMNLMNKLRMSN